MQMAPRLGPGGFSCYWLTVCHRVTHATTVPTLSPAEGARLRLRQSDIFSFSASIAVGQQKRATHLGRPRGSAMCPNYGLLGAPRGEGNDASGQRLRVEALAARHELCGASRIDRKCGVGCGHEHQAVLSLAAGVRVLHHSPFCKGLIGNFLYDWRGGFAGRSGRSARRDWATVDAGVGATAELATATISGARSCASAPRFGRLPALSAPRPRASRRRRPPRDFPTGLRSRA